MKNIGFILTVGLLSLLATSFDIETTAVTKSDIVDFQWYSTERGVAIWGRSTTRDAFLIDSYDTTLQNLASFKKKIPNFTIDEIHQTYRDENAMEFVFLDKKRNAEAFIRLDNNLTEVYFSGPFPRFKRSLRDSTTLSLDYLKASNTMADLRMANDYWEVVEINKSKSGVDSSYLALQHSSLNRFEKLPIFDFDWRFNFDEIDAEYCRFICADNNSVFLFVNFSSSTSEQYLYCVNSKDGTLKYKTQLIVDGITSCIYSNCFFDKDVNEMFIGGTCFFADKRGSGSPGAVIIRLDHNGKIVSYKTEQEITFSYPPSGEFNGTALGIPSRNQNSHYRFCKIDKLSSGEIVTFVDCYSLILINNGTRNSIRFLDENYHYLMSQSFQYKTDGSKLIPISSSTANQSYKYLAGVNFQGIRNFETEKSHLVDMDYPNNVVKLAETPLDSSYFIDFCYDENSGLLKCLMKNKFTNHTGNMDLYFKSTTGKKNFVAFQKPEPVVGQDVLIENQFLVRDYGFLYKLTPVVNGYKLGLETW